MIEIFKQQFTSDMSAEEKINRTREFLQLILLKIMYDKNFFENLTFVGGTALRIIYDTKRFSEDLDFSLTKKAGYNFSKISPKLIRTLGLYGLKAEAKLKDQKIVQSALLKFSGLLKDLGLSYLKEQNLSIKIEIDSNPPKGWHIENTLINKAYMFNVAHFDLSSLYATKLHACFYRKFIKGRDFYDFIWYLGKKIKPNYILLNNAFKQTEGYNPKIQEENFKAFLLDKIKKIDLKEAKKDVERFLIDKNELRLFNLEMLQDAIRASLP